jgi:predicted membrane-bound spermidine synthase
MLSTFNRRLRHHRRKALCALAVLAVAGVALSAKTALMSAHGHDDVSDIVAVCMIVGGYAAVAGVAVFAVRRLLQRPRWLISAPLLPALPVLPSTTGFLARAGPAPPALLQVFRL